MPIHLYHCTFDNNTSPIGNAIDNSSILYVYNCIFTGDIPQISGTIIDGNNLIEGVNCTREQVFGSNIFTNNYIIPLSFAVSADELDNSINLPGHSL
jgi:hypothetical protein